MSIWSWLKLSAGLWLLRKAVRIARWLLLFVVAVVAWPLTLVTAAGYVTAWRRGWPPARLRRAAAWALTGAGVWLLAAALRFRAWRTAARAGVRDWQHSWPRVGALFAHHWGQVWPHAAALATARAFVLLAPATVPAGLGLAALLWAWRKYAITTGLAGLTASAPITFDARQWRRQVGTAKDLTEAPGAVPLLGRGGRIRSAAPSARSGTAGTRSSPCRPRLDPAYGHRGRYRKRQDEPDDPAAGGLVHRQPGRRPGRAREPAAAGRAGLQGRPRLAPQGRPDPPPALRGRCRPGRGLAR